MAHEDAGPAGIEREFADIVSQVRMHLELQRALGVRFVEAALQPVSSPASAAPQPARIEVHEPEAAPIKPVQPAGLEAIRMELAGCKRCGLHAAGSKPLAGEGPSPVSLVFVGGWPSREDGRQGTPFSDEAGKLLTDIIVKGMNLKREDVFVTTVVKCAPDHRGALPDEIVSCEQILIRQLEALRPRIIVALGGPAVQALFKTNEDIASLRGTWQHYRGIPVMPTFEPAQLLKNPSDKRAVWEDIKKVIAELRKG